MKSIESTEKKMEKLSRHSIDKEKHSREKKKAEKEKSGMQIYKMWKYSLE